VTGEAGVRALALINKLLAERPEKVGHDFSETTRCLTAFRDELISHFRKTRADGDRERLAGVNAVLSVILAGHFPLGDIPWRHIEEARKRLEELVRG
jgi:hypothetical protein